MISGDFAQLLKNVPWSFLCCVSSVPKASFNLAEWFLSLQQIHEPEYLIVELSPLETNRSTSPKDYREPRMYNVHTLKFSADS